MSTDRKSEENGMLSRWAKRKEAVRAEEEEAAATAVAERPVAQPEPETAEEAMAQLAEENPELAEQISAIDVDKLTYEDDFSIFMKDKVPDFIRRRALSKLWLSNPILANLDGLNEYDEDYTQASNAAEMVMKAFEDARKREEEKLKQAAKAQVAEGDAADPSQSEAEAADLAAGDSDDLAEDDDGDLEA